MFGVVSSRKRAYNPLFSTFLFLLLSNPIYNDSAALVGVVLSKSEGDDE